MYDDDALLPVSALQHLAFCRRQCALIHLESVWVENRLTAEGRELHERVHEGESESRPGMRVARGLRLMSRKLGLTGQADLVEFHLEDGPGEDRTKLPGRDGWWRAYPIEYKRGKPKTDNCDEVQLCAQAMCLEEMLSFRIEKGALFYGKPRRRKEVEFTKRLRFEVERLSADLHEMISAGVTPAAEHGPHCERCSLRDECMPEAGNTVTAEKYLRGQLLRAKED